MLLSIEVSMYFPRFVVFDVTQGKPRIVFTSCNNRRREANRSRRYRTSEGAVLDEIENKVTFILGAFQIEHVVWTMRKLGIANKERSYMALGVMLTALHKAGIPMPHEIIGSRIRLHLAGDSKASAFAVTEAVNKLLPELPEEDRLYSVPIASGLAWYRQNNLIP